jgi:hypothetical protein
MITEGQRAAARRNFRNQAKSRWCRRYRLHSPQPSNGRELFAPAQLVTAVSQLMKAAFQDFLPSPYLKKAASLKNPGSNKMVPPVEIAIVSQHRRFALLSAPE